MLSAQYTLGTVLYGPWRIVKTKDRKIGMHPRANYSIETV